MKKICPEGILWWSRDQDSALSLPWLGVQSLVRGLRPCKLHGTEKSVHIYWTVAAKRHASHLPTSKATVSAQRHSSQHYLQLSGGRAQWPSTDEWIKTGVDIHWSVIQPSNKEKSGRWYNMDAPWGYDTKWNMLPTKGQILYDSTHMSFLEEPNSERQRAEWSQGLELWEENWELLFTGYRVSVLKDEKSCRDG